MWPSQTVCTMQRDILKIYKDLTILQTQHDLILIKLVFIEEDCTLWVEFEKVWFFALFTQTYDAHDVLVFNNMRWETVCLPSSNMKQQSQYHDLSQFKVGCSI